MPVFSKHLLFNSPNRSSLCDDVLLYIQQPLFEILNIYVIIFISVSLCLSLQIDVDWCWLAMIDADWCWSMLMLIDAMLPDAACRCLMLIGADWYIIYISYMLVQPDFLFGAYLQSFSGNFWRGNTINIFYVYCLRIFIWPIWSALL